MNPPRPPFLPPVSHPHDFGGEGLLVLVDLAQGDVNALTCTLLIGRAHDALPDFVHDPTNRGRVRRCRVLAPFGREESVARRAQLQHRRP